MRCRPWRAGPAERLWCLVTASLLLAILSGGCALGTARVVPEGQHPVPTVTLPLLPSPTDSAPLSGAGEIVPTSPPTATLAPTATLGPPLHLLASHPIPGDLAVVPERPLRLVFDQPLDREALASALRIDPPTEGTLALAAPEVVEFTPAEGWLEGFYRVTISADLRAEAGGTLNAPIEIPFGTDGRGVPVPVLMYHQIAELPDGASALQRTWTVSPAAYAVQMQHLLDDGWHSISPSALVTYLTAGEPLPSRSVIITHDDGYRDVYTTVWPLLRETRLRPTLFLVASYSGYGAYLNWDMLRELVADGFHVGVHTYDHVSLRGVADDVLDRQLGVARALIEEQLGVTAAAFCYPYGAYDANTLNALTRYGYTSAVTLNPGAYQPSNDPLRLNRQLVTYDTSLEEFVALLPRDSDLALAAADR